MGLLKIGLAETLALSYIWGMATFTELQDRVSRRVIDLPAAVLAEVPDLVNEALREIQERHNFKVMEAVSAQYITVDAVRNLAVVPTDFKEWRGKPYLSYFAGGTKELMIGPNAQQVLRRLEPEDTGYPMILKDGEPVDEDGTRYFEVWPLSDVNSDWADGEYRVTVPYWRYLDPLVATGDTNWFTNKAPLYLIYKAVSEAFAIDWDEERMAVWNQKAELQYNKIVLVDKKFRLSNVTAFVPHRRVLDVLSEE